MGDFLHLTKNKPIFFEALTIRTHDIELSMSSIGKDLSFAHDPRRDKVKQEPKRWSKFVPMNDNKESMNINLSPMKFTPK